MSQSRLDALKKRAAQALTQIHYHPDDADVTDDETPLRTYLEFDDEDEVKQDDNQAQRKTPAVTLFQQALAQFYRKCDDEKQSNDEALAADVIFFELTHYFYEHQIAALAASHQTMQTKLQFNTYYCLPLSKYPDISVREHYLAIYAHIYNPWQPMEKCYDTETERAMVKSLKLFINKAQCLFVLQRTRALPSVEDAELALLMLNIAVAKKFAPAKKNFTPLNAILTHSTFNNQQQFNHLVSWLENECLIHETDYYQGYWQRGKHTGAYVAELNSKLDKYDYERMLHLILEDAYTVYNSKGVDELTHVFLELNPRVSQPLQKGKKAEYQSIEPLSITRRTLSL
jgi:hypothetical protein